MIKWICFIAWYVLYVLASQVLHTYSHISHGPANQLIDWWFVLVKVNVDVLLAMLFYFMVWNNMKDDQKSRIIATGLACLTAFP